MLLELQHDIAETARTLDAIERVRAQLQRLGQSGNVRPAADQLEQKFMTVEGNILDLRTTGRGQDQIRYPAMLAQQLIYLAMEVGASDFTPTESQVAVQKILEAQLRDTRAAVDRLIRTDLAQFNTMLTGRGLKAVEVTM
jgi:hypothetical protein